MRECNWVTKFRYWEGLSEEMTDKLDLKGIGVYRVWKS